ncbi:MAG: ATP-binding protein [bacterium]
MENHPGISGIDAVREIQWGAHLCQFYQTIEDLVDILVPNFKSGIERRECCLWHIAEPLNGQEALEAIRKIWPDFDEYVTRGQIKIIPPGQCYRETKETDHPQASSNAMNPMTTLCSYPLDRCGVAETVDIVSRHQSAFIKRAGQWELIENSGGLSHRPESRPAPRMHGPSARMPASPAPDMPVNDTLDAPVMADTRLRQTEKSLSAASLYTRSSLIEASLDPLVTISADGKIMDVNKATELVTGRSREQLIGSDFSKLRRAEKKLKMYMAKLEKSNQELQDFAFTASHDLQEPLCKIQAFGNQLKIKYFDIFGDEGRDYLERMQSAANRMQALIRALLGYSRVTTKAEPFSTINLTGLIQEVMADLETRVRETGGRVEIEKLADLEADPNQMRQLFQNLISNALKFHGEEKPLIRICGQMDPSTSHYLIYVQDNGIGFDEKYLDCIFMPFQRLHGRSSSYEGTGMGLAICRKIVERHNGKITARSAPGKGSTFIVTLPVKQLKEEEG